jgi:hypothetical protein
LLGSTLCVCLPRLAETFTASLEGGLIDLAVAFDDINGLSVSIVVGGDLNGASVPSHRSSTTGEGFDEDHGLAWGHPETFGESFVLKCLASLLVDAFPFLRRLID